MFTQIAVIFTYLLYNTVTINMGALGSRESTIMYAVVNIGAELLGLAICWSEYQSPDVLSDIKASLNYSAGVDIVRAMLSFMLIIAAIVLGDGISAAVKSTISTLMYIFTGAGAVAGAALCVFYEIRYESTDMASTPWLSIYYYLGVVLYSLMKMILYVSACLYFVQFVNELKEQRRYTPVKAQVNPDIEMRQIYQRVPVNYQE